MVVVSAKRGQVQNFDVGNDFEKLRSLVSELVRENNNHATCWGWRLEGDTAEVIASTNRDDVSIKVVGVTEDIARLMKENHDFINAE